MLTLINSQHPVRGEYPCKVWQCLDSSGTKYYVALVNITATRLGRMNGSYTLNVEFSFGYSICTRNQNIRKNTLEASVIFQMQGGIMNRETVSTSKV